MEFSAKRGGTIKRLCKYSTLSAMDGLWCRLATCRRLEIGAYRRVNNPPQVGNLHYKASGTAF